ncbi:hypothetical protein FQN49_006171 [Arthroderma sp. PD_2]|nr:hypothetical protein FQN49_006171 [Arthroderma sp. PD_2]
MPLDKPKSDISETDKPKNAMSRTAIPGTNKPVDTKARDDNTSLLFSSTMATAKHKLEEEDLYKGREERIRKTIRIIEQVKANNTKLPDTKPADKMPKYNPSKDNATIDFNSPAAAGPRLPGLFNMFSQDRDAAWLTSTDAIATYRDVTRTGDIVDAAHSMIHERVLEDKESLTINRRSSIASAKFQSAMTKFQAARAAVDSARKDKVTADFAYTSSVAKMEASALEVDSAAYEMSDAATAARRTRTTTPAWAAMEVFATSEEINAARARSSSWPADITLGQALGMDSDTVVKRIEEVGRRERPHLFQE